MTEVTEHTHQTHSFTDSAGYLAILGAGDAVMAGQGLITGAIGASTRGRREGFFGSHTWIPDFLSGDPSAGMFQPRTGHRGLLPPQNSPAFSKQGSLLQTLLCPVKSDLPTKGKHTGPYPSVTLVCSWFYLFQRLVQSWAQKTTVRCLLMIRMNLSIQ